VLNIRRRLVSWAERTVLAANLFRGGGPGFWSGNRRFIFVCTGNICRSPYAEAVARGLGADTLSCGIDAHVGQAADPTALIEAARRGKDLSGHTATRWHDVLLLPGDVVIGMQLVHTCRVLRRARDSGCPVVLLSSFLANGHRTLWDPYGRDQSEYSAVFDLIDSSVPSLVGRATERST
jgi:protein-tyrosine phosphatase